MWHLRLFLSLLVAALPGFLKLPLYRWLYGFRIGRGVRIGLSPFIGVRQCVIGDHVRIGSFNAFVRVEELTIGAHAHLGFGNLVRGGKRVTIGAYATILRLNVINAILDGDVDPGVSTLELGTGAVVTTGHWLDFSGGIEVGAHTVLGGRNSSLWTHNRQRVRPITIGHHCYLGSEVRLAPGVEIAPLCLIALGSVIVGQLGPTQSLIGGNPAAVMRPLEERDLVLVTRSTRKDIPQELVLEGLPPAVCDLARSHQSAEGAGPSAV
jgi:acetyltransferase-like isoleucine patch superfamily enzyme